MTVLGIGPPQHRVCCEGGVPDDVGSNLREDLVPDRSPTCDLDLSTSGWLGKVWDMTETNSAASLVTRKGTSAFYFSCGSAARSSRRLQIKSSSVPIWREGVLRVSEVCMSSTEHPELVRRTGLRAKFRVQDETREKYVISTVQLCRCNARWLGESSWRSGPWKASCRTMSQQLKPSQRKHLKLNGLVWYCTSFRSANDAQFCKDLITRLRSCCQKKYVQLPPVRCKPSQKGVQVDVHIVSTFKSFPANRGEASVLWNSRTAATKFFILIEMSDAAGATVSVFPS